MLLVGYRMDNKDLVVNDCGKWQQRKCKRKHLEHSLGVRATVLVECLSKRYKSNNVRARLRQNDATSFSKP